MFEDSKILIYWLGEQGSSLGSGSIQDLVNSNQNVRAAVIGYAITAGAQPTSSFTVGQNISTTASQTSDGGTKALSATVTGTKPLTVRTSNFK